MNKQELESIKKELETLKQGGFQVSNPEGASSGSLQISHLGLQVDENSITPTSAKPFTSTVAFRLQKIELKKRDDEQALKPTKNVKIRATILLPNGQTASFNIGQGTFDKLVEMGEKPFNLVGQLKAFETTRSGLPFTQRWVCVTNVKPASATPENANVAQTAAANVAQTPENANVAIDVDDL